MESASREAVDSPSCAQQQDSTAASYRSDSQTPQPSGEAAGAASGGVGELGIESRSSSIARSVHLQEYSEESAAGASVKPMRSALQQRIGHAAAHAQMVEQWGDLDGSAGPKEEPSTWELDGWGDEPSVVGGNAMPGVGMGAVAGYSMHEVCAVHA